MRTAYNQNPIDPTCKLCNQAEDKKKFFLLVYSIVVSIVIGIVEMLVPV
jgi:hypothetical protein